MMCSYCDSAMPADARFCGECGRMFAVSGGVPSTPDNFSEVSEATAQTPIVANAPAISDAEEFLDFAPPDLDKTVIVGSESDTVTTLQFSTGESVHVLGAGLIGRHPVPEPGEYFDQLITIVDPSKSVSKTHVEFGQTGGYLWILDRHSGNGTTLADPGGEPHHCEAGKRYRAGRGSRVTLGQQFFDIV